MTEYYRDTLLKWKTRPELVLVILLYVAFIILVTSVIVPGTCFTVTNPLVSGSVLLVARTKRVVLHFLQTNII